MRWLIASANSCATGASPVVDNASFLATQKLCHALATFFVHFSRLWPNCVRHVVLCLKAGRPLPVDEARDAAPVADLVRSLDWPLFRVALWFVKNLVDEMDKVDINSVKLYVPPVAPAGFPTAATNQLPAAWTLTAGWSKLARMPLQSCMPVFFLVCSTNAKSRSCKRKLSRGFRYATRSLGAISSGPAHLAC